jgi:uncharacterized membrane protein
MSDVHIVIGMFAGEYEAEAALERLQPEYKEHRADIQAALALRRGRDDQFHYTYAGLSPGKGALGGAVLGAVVGIMTGGVGLVLGAAGAAVGGLVGKRRQDQGLMPERLNQIAASLAPGSSAVVAVVGAEALAELQGRLAELGADVVTVDMAADIAEQIWAHRDEAAPGLDGPHGGEATRGSSS